VDDISAHIDAEVAADGARSRVLGVGGAKQHSTLLHCPKSLPHHRNDGTRAHVADELGKEAFLAEVGIVLFEERVWGVHHLGAEQPQPPPFKPLHDLTHKTTLDRIRFAHDEGSLTVCSILECTRILGWLLF